MLDRQFHGIAHQGIQAGIGLRAFIQRGDALPEFGDLIQDLGLLCFVRGFLVFLLQAFDALFLGLHRHFLATDLRGGLLDELDHIIN